MAKSSCERIKMSPHIKLPPNDVYVVYGWRKMYTCLLFGILQPAYELGNILTKYLWRNVRNKGKAHIVARKGGSRIRLKNQTMQQYYIEKSLQ